MSIHATLKWFQVVIIMLVKMCTRFENMYVARYL